MHGIHGGGTSINYHPLLELAEDRDAWLKLVPHEGKIHDTI